MGDLTKTQTTDSGSTVTGVIGLHNQFYSPGGVSAATKKVSVSAGGPEALIEDISTSGWSGADPQPDPPFGTAYTFVIQLKLDAFGSGYYEEHEFVYMSDADDDDVERAFSFSVTGRQLSRQESTNYGPGRSGKPVMPNDVAYTDSWDTVQPATWDATFGSFHTSGTNWWSDGMGVWGPTAAISSVGITFTQHKGQNGLLYAYAHDLEWSKVAMDFSGMSKTYGSYPTGYGMIVQGGGGSLDLYCTHPNFSSYQVSAWAHSLPHIPDFRDVVLARRDGSLLNEALIDLPCRASLEVPDSIGWSTEP